MKNKLPKFYKETQISKNDLTVGNLKTRPKGTNHFLEFAKITNIKIKGLGSKGTIEKVKRHKFGEKLQHQQMTKN